MLKVEGRLETLGLLFLRGLPDDIHEPARYLGIGGQSFLHLPGEGLGLTFGRHRVLTREQLVECNAELVDVGGGIDACVCAILFAQHLLRRRILGSADETEAREFVATIHTRDTQVHETDIGAVLHHDIGRLDVAVDDTARMHVVQSVEHGADGQRDFLYPRRTLGQVAYILVYVLALHEVAKYEDGAAVRGILAVAYHLDEVGVAEGQ